MPDAERGLPDASALIEASSPPQERAGRRVRTLAAVVIATLLVALVASDFAVSSARHWWDSHSVTGSVLSSLLIVGVSALILDEVIARRQRKERRTSVAVQVLIVYDQANRAYASLLARGEGNVAGHGEAPDELRTLAAMLLSASPNLFDDLDARSFLEQVQRVTGVMFRAISADLPLTGEDDAALASSMRLVHQAAEPVVARLPPAYRELLVTLPDS